MIYAGTTVRYANVTPSARCFPAGNSDGIDVVSFGRLPDDVVAASCTYTYAGDIWQADVMLNDTAGLFTTRPLSPSCVDSFDLEAVMTHERGHSYGIAHVENDPRGNALTMSQVLGRCDPSARSLGAGDLLALDEAY